MRQRTSYTQWLKFIALPFPAGVRSYLSLISARAKFWRDYQHYSRLAPEDAQPEVKNFLPCLYDNTSETPLDYSYYYQDAWAFERIIARRPSRHVDIGSHHKFVSLLSKVVPTTMVDLRPLPVALDTLQFVEGSILSLPFEDHSLPSVSSLCVVEHIGLGRYGDPLDPEGSVKAFQELKRVVEPGGDLFLSVPTDDVNRIYFNAHRAFAQEYLLRLFAPFDVIDRRYIYGSEYGGELKAGFGTGCYHLRAPV